MATPSSRPRAASSGAEFNRFDREADPREDGSGIAGAGADHERALTGLRLHLGQKLAKHRWRRKEAASAKRQSAVDIGERARLFGHELLARDLRHRGEDQRVGHALRPKLALDHRGSRLRVIGNW